jgi:hypothetical protein
MGEVAEKCFTNLDNYMRGNYETLTCKEISEIYNRILQTAQCLKGNAYGFTGFTEFLVFRVLYWQLGGSFEWNKYPRFPDKAETYAHQFENKEKKIAIGQSLPILVNDKKRVPDIAVFRDGRPFGFVQIKKYLTERPS